MKRKVILDIGTGKGERAVELALKNPDADVYAMDLINYEKEIKGVEAGNNPLRKRIKNLHPILGKKGDARKSKNFDFLGDRKIDEIEINFIGVGVHKIPEHLLEKLSKNAKITIRIDPQHLGEVFEGIKYAQQPENKKEFNKIQHVTTEQIKNFIEEELKDPNSFTSKSKKEYEEELKEMQEELRKKGFRVVLKKQYPFRRKPITSYEKEITETRGYYHSIIATRGKHHPLIEKLRSKLRRRK